MSCQKTFILPFKTETTLRYWTMDETGMSPRVDKVTGDALAPYTNHLDFDSSAGLHGNALHLSELNPTNPVGAAGVLGSFSADTKDGGLSVAVWVNAASAAATFAFINVGLTNGGSNAFDLEVDVGSSSAFLYQDAAGTHQSIPISIPVGSWQFLHLFFDKATGKAGYSINNGAESTFGSSLVSGNGDGYSVDVRTAGMSPFTDVLIDELAVCLNHKFTPAQVDYLYNAGAGRTWPITLP